MFSPILILSGFFGAYFILKSKCYKFTSMESIKITNPILIHKIQEIALWENRTPENMVETILLDHIKDYNG